MEKQLNQKAEQKKQLGNDEYKKQNYQAAINYYTDAIGKSGEWTDTGYRDWASWDDILE